MGIFDLSGRTALVTGASRGIGEAIAKRYAAQGARVILAARGVERLEAIAAELGAQARVLALDLAATQEIPARLAELAPPFDAVDVLVNNAGMTADNVLARMSLEEWEKVLRVNLTGTYAVTKGVIRGMMRRRWGRVISISSVVGLMGNPGQTNYAASKAGLVGFSKSLARELASRGVTANVIAPGYIETAMTADLPRDSQEQLTAAIPLGRLGTCEDVGAAALYLASEEAGYVTGQVLNVSGGLYL